MSGATCRNGHVDTEKLIENICSSSDLLELADSLEQYLTSLKGTPDKTAKLPSLKSAIARNLYYDSIVSKPSECHKLYTRFQGKNAVLLFLDWYLQDDKSKEVYLKNIKGIVTYIRMNFAEPQMPIISDKQISDTLYHLEKRYSFVSKVFHGGLLKIGILNNTHGTLNSFYLSQFLFGSLVDDMIILTHPIPGFGCPQEQTLLHELGHALHTRLTMSTKTMPASFIEMCNAILPQDFDNEADAAEAFADFFALAASIGTSLEGSNPLSELKSELKEIIAGYFNLLLKTYEKNPNGELTLKQMQTIASNKK